MNDISGPAQRGATEGVSRRHMLKLSGSVGLAAAGLITLTSCGAGAGGSGGPSTGAATTSGGPSGSPNQVSAPAPHGVLGVNVNDDAHWEDDFAELEAVSATWVRGFFTMTGAKRENVAEQPVIKTLLDVGKRGYGTVLSLKFPYNDAPIPTPGSAAMATAQRQLSAVLPVVMGAVDIVVIGNEPFIECLAQQRSSQQINVFYQTMAQQAIAYREQHGGTTRLYMGALNHLDQPDWRTSATNAWMDYVRSTSAIDGVDIHPHVSSLSNAQQYLDYVVPRLRPDQTFLATEFSLVQLWQQHMTEPVSAAFCTTYGLPSGTPLWQVIKDSLATPFPQQKWNDFLSLSPWFADNRGFIEDQVAAFRATGKLAVAHYNITQDKFTAAGFEPTSTPWVLNSMFCPYTVQHAQNGLPGQTPQWIQGFHNAVR